MNTPTADRRPALGAAVNARDKFHRDQRVQLSELGIQRVSPSSHRLTRRATTGVVIGFGHEDYLVRVLPDGIKTVSAYHMDFWEAERAS